MGKPDMMVYPFNSLNPAKAEWINGIFARIDHSLGYEINIKEHENTEIIPSIFFQEKWNNFRN